MPILEHGSEAGFRLKTSCSTPSLLQVRQISLEKPEVRASFFPISTAPSNTALVSLQVFSIRILLGQSKQVYWTCLRIAHRRNGHPRQDVLTPTLRGNGLQPLSAISGLLMFWCLPSPIRPMPDSQQSVKSLQRDGRIDFRYNRMHPHSQDFRELTVHGDYEAWWELTDLPVYEPPPPSYESLQHSSLKPCIKHIISEEISSRPYGLAPKDY